MENHLTDTQVNVLVHYMNSNSEYYNIKEGEVEIYQNHINVCQECNNRFRTSDRLYKDLNTASRPHLYKYVATILLLLTFGFFQYTATDYSKNFVLNEELEEVVGEEFRSIPIEVIQPKLSENFTDEIQFKIEMSLDTKVVLRIFDNSEKSVYEKQIDALQFKIDEIETPGVYYWRIDSTDDILYHGKFYYKKPK